MILDNVKRLCRERGTNITELEKAVGIGNWMKTGSLKTGAFELDSVSASGPPAKVTIGSTSLAFSSSLRQTKKSRAWENYTLSGIAAEIASGGGMSNGLSIYPDRSGGHRS